MEREVEKRIEKIYELIQKYIPHDIRIDSLEVVKQVEEYRQFWKPEKTNVILLAESHVYTDKQDYEIQCNKFILNKIIPNYPTHFVRFVYCLGYGENKLLERTVKNNEMGTWQFWKIFSSCVTENGQDLGFRRVLKKGTPSLLQRLLNKVNVLQKMQERGIWLLDASIVGLAGSEIKKYPDTCSRITEICWNSHLEKMIKNDYLKYIIIIGKNVEAILSFELQKLDIPFTVIPQPQARGSSQWQLENYKKYQRICAKYC